MARYIVAAVLLIVYMLGSIWAVNREGVSYREALRRERLAARPSEKPAPVADPRPLVAATAAGQARSAEDNPGEPHRFPRPARRMDRRQPAARRGLNHKKCTFDGGWHCHRGAAVCRLANPSPGALFAFGRPKRSLEKPYHSRRHAQHDIGARLQQ